MKRNLVRVLLLATAAGIMYLIFGIVVGAITEIYDFTPPPQSVVGTYSTSYSGVAWKLDIEPNGTYLQRISVKGKSLSKKGKWKLGKSAFGRPQIVLYDAMDDNYDDQIPAGTIEQHVALALGIHRSLTGQTELVVNSERDIRLLRM